jgi:pimeloyl-ACP methyl ester carboxylesterase
VPIRSGFLNLGGTKLYYETAGSGPAVVLLHAGIADCRMWDSQFSELARRYAVIRCDLRGFGRTVPAPGEYSDHDDVAALLDSLGIAQAAVVGSSYGGKVALDFALSHPGRVAALVLCAPDVGGREPTPELVAFGNAEHAALARGDIDAAVELNLRTWVDGPSRAPSAVDPALRARVGEMQSEIFRMSIPDGMITRDLEPPAAGRLASISIPTLVIVGELDMPTFVRTAEWVARQIPRASLIRIPGAAHMANMEEPVMFERLVEGFLVAHMGN